MSGPDHHGMGWCWTQKQAFQSWAASAWRRALPLVNVVVWALLAMWMGHGVEASCSALSEPCRHTPRCTLKKLLWSLIVSVHPLRLVFCSCELGSCYNLWESRCVPGSVSRVWLKWGDAEGKKLVDMQRYYANLVRLLSSVWIWLLIPWLKGEWEGSAADSHQHIVFDVFVSGRDG